jgi:outer membrane protein OmpA-like peptidoglycan-associated protein
MARPLLFGLSLSLLVSLALRATFSFAFSAEENFEATESQGSSEHRTLTKPLAAELHGHRGQLALTLIGNGRTKPAREIAPLHVMSDCRVHEEANTNGGERPEDRAACRGAFRDGPGKVQTVQEASERAAETSPPAPEPPARDYLVFFDFDKTEIRPDAASILDRVAKGIFSIGSSSITLIGHADTSGPAEYNRWLSEQRAFSVRNYLLGKGIAADVVAKGRGEEDPRVATPDGIEEQENRRVEIQID